MVMLGAHQSIITFTAAATQYSDRFQPEGASRIAAQSRVTDGSPAAVTVTLQGGWTDSDDDTTADWVDLDFTGAGTDGTRTALDDGGTPAATTIFAEWPVYRYKVESDEAATIEIRTTEIG